MNSNRSADLAALLLRLALGVLYLAHSLQKIFVFTLPGTAQFLFRWACRVGSVM